MCGNLCENIAFATAVGTKVCVKAKHCSLEGTRVHGTKRTTGFEATVYVLSHISFRRL